jgi:hypothetical protein
MTNPASWQVWVSTDGGVTYILSKTVSGSSRSDGFYSSGEKAYVVGVDGSGNPVTQDSNVVTVA